jgi:hypothetical protein
MIVRLLWPPQIRYTPKGRHGNATDMCGRRYGDYRWFTVSLGHLHFSLWPKHVRRVWMSWQLRQALDG